MRVLRDSAGYDLRTNAGPWLGLVLAAPIPVLAFASPNPSWVRALSLAVPFAWAAILGAAARVAGLKTETISRMTTEASAAQDSHAAESTALRGEADVQRRGRERSESHHRDDLTRMITEASTAQDSHAAESTALRGEADVQRRGRERSESHHRDDVTRMTAEALTAGDSHAAESTLLREEAAVERTGREISEAQGRSADADLALAQRVNRSLLPEEILRPDLAVVVRQIPCSYVGGDYLHAALPRPDVLYLCVGDVSGHGVSAALVVSRIHGFVQRWVAEDLPPEAILAALDRAAVQILEHTPFFLTFAVFRVDLVARRIDFATAGHPAQLLLQPDGTLQSLSTGNGILGLAHRGVLGPPRRGSASYASGDTLILFTDGLYEIAPRGGGEMLGEPGLLADLPRLARSPPQVVASEILRRVTAFGRPGPFEDDVSLLIARFGSPAGE
jgi:serine phosphatase RsbU (regulator of sigma subunit)